MFSSTKSIKHCQLKFDDHKLRLKNNHQNAKEIHPQRKHIHESMILQARAVLRIRNICCRDIVFVTSSPTGIGIAGTESNRISCSSPSPHVHSHLNSPCRPSRNFIRRACTCSAPRGSIGALRALAVDTCNDVAVIEGSALVWDWPGALLWCPDL